ncbi:hypothetical protein F443_09558 [Phytophthora nicotianae P1569]|uniref:Uncharacterized protein n=2 Tax=Phytophthora nicotianae TaxID=4792 RepID=V9F4L2_PHYNI|nr:hypothetical protein F443_09558 [Phytophthora nicotianae P1569]ETO74729.1 hypothetical protein F444_09622 [Phytophthora nicotianae P1976]
MLSSKCYPARSTRPSHITNTCGTWWLVAQESVRP